MSGPEASASLRSLLQSATARLTAAGVPSPRHDAESLAGHLLGVNRGQLAAVESLDPVHIAAYDVLIARRVTREPLQHLTGRAGFRHLDLAVGPGVFIPRPETEVMVGWCLQGMRSGAVAVDLCAGSGAIALSLATEAPGTRVYAVEKDPAAYAWLARNADGSGVRLILADIADVPTVLPELLGAVNLVVSNPPYIPLGSRPQELEVARYDPAAAFWGGRDGLDVVHMVERIARRLLIPGGRLAIEHADTQGGAVARMLAAAGGWSEIADHPDLAGRDRFATACWAG